MRTKIAAVADVHIGNHRKFGGPTIGGLNSRCLMAVSSFASALKQASELGASDFFVCGDLFDVSKPSPPIVEAVMRAIHSVKSMHVHLIRGNHDTHSFAGHDDALAPIELLDNVSVWRNDVSTADVAFLPYTMNQNTAERIASACQHPDTRFIFGHFGISDQSTPIFLRGSGGSIDAHRALDAMAKSGDVTLIVGDWHVESEWISTRRPPHRSNRVIQCGPLVPTGFDNPGYAVGSMVLIDQARNIERVRISGPRFVSASFEAFDDGDIVPSNDAVYLRFKAATKNKPAAMKKIAELRKTGLIVDGEVDVDGEVQRATAKSAAIAARGEHSIRDQIAAYVGEMSMPRDVSRQEVLERAMRHVAL